MKNHKRSIISIFFYLALVAFLSSFLLLVVYGQFNLNVVGVALSMVVSLLAAISLGLTKYHLNKSDDLK